MRDEQAIRTIAQGIAEDCYACPHPIEILSAEMGSAGRYSRWVVKMRIGPERITDMLVIYEGKREYYPYWLTDDGAELPIQGATCP
jgi:hypothetical protein